MIIAQDCNSVIISGLAFALMVNAGSGEVFLAQYASLDHPSEGSSVAAFDDQVSLNSGALQMSVSLTDGDADRATDSGNNIGQLIRFDDDGPLEAQNSRFRTFVQHPGQCQNRFQSRHRC